MRWLVLLCVLAAFALASDATATANKQHTQRRSRFLLRDSTSRGLASRLTSSGSYASSKRPALASAVKAPACPGQDVWAQVMSRINFLPPGPLTRSESSHPTSSPPSPNSDIRIGATDGAPKQDDARTQTDLISPNKRILDPSSPLPTDRRPDPSSHIPKYPNPSISFPPSTLSSVPAVSSSQSQSGSHTSLHTLSFDVSEDDQGAKAAGKHTPSRLVNKRHHQSYPLENIANAAKGLPAKRASVESGQVCLSPQLGMFLVELLKHGNVRVGEIAGGIHRIPSGHYAGNAVDVVSFKDEPLTKSSSHAREVVALCLRMGGRVYHASLLGNPYNQARQDYVHCQFGKDYKRPKRHVTIFGRVGLALDSKTRKTINLSSPSSQEPSTDE